MKNYYHKIIININKKSHFIYYWKFSFFKYKLITNKYPKFAELCFYENHFENGKWFQRNMDYLTREELRKGKYAKK